jgi:hypothetical protein
MASPPPGPPGPGGVPTFPVEASRIAWDEAAIKILDALVMHEALPKWAQVNATKIATVVLGAVEAFVFAVQSDLAKMIGEHANQTADVAGPPLLEVAAFGLSDFFNTKITADQLRSRAQGGGASDAARELGAAVLGAMFGQFEGGNAPTPEQGQHNAERMLTFNISTALEGWLMGVSGLGWLSKWFPNWADLDDVMSANLGLGRINRRILQPLVDAIIVDPFTAQLNSRFRATQLSEAQLVRAFNVGWIGEAEFFQAMAERGWSRERAGFLRDTMSPAPSASDLGRFYELGYIDEERIEKELQRAGYGPEWARMFRAGIVQDRLRAQADKTEALAVDMYAEREIDEQKLAGLLQSAGRSAAEVEAISGYARLRRSRPKAISKGDIEAAFTRGIANLDQLRRFYQLEGYDGETITILEQLALGERLAYEEKLAKAADTVRELPPKTASRSEWEAAYVKGLADVAQLRDFYESQNYTADSITLMLQLVTARRAEAEAAVKDKAERDAAAAAAKAKGSPPGLGKGDVEALYVAGQMGDAELLANYSRLGYAGAAAEQLRALAANRKKARERAEAEAAARKADAARAAEARAAGALVAAPPRPSRADVERAYQLGLADEAELHARYLELGYAPDTAELLLAIQVEQRAARLAPKPTKNPT